MELAKKQIISDLRNSICRLEGYVPSNNPLLDAALGPISGAFPNGVFPLGSIHEFITHSVESIAATTGFIAAVHSKAIAPSATTIWITRKRVFPPSLIAYGLLPERFIFIHTKNDQDTLWTLDEALRCPSIPAVIAEVPHLDFQSSRRLQLAVESSRATGFVIRHTKGAPTTTASLARWMVTPSPSEGIDELPGIGWPKWKVELLRVRNGKTGKWWVQWNQGRLIHSSESEPIEWLERKVG